MTVSEVLARILMRAVPTDVEPVSIYDAAGRVLAEDLRAKLTQPPFEASAMDGYAVCAADIANVPVSLAVIGKSAAGHGFAGQVRRGEAVRIFTGAPVPPGADTVVIQENVKTEAHDRVTILKGERQGGNVRPRGYDFREGEILLTSGTRLGSLHLMLAAAMNYATVPVRRRPSVAILANGDELVTPGAIPGEGQIVSSIPAALKPAVEAWGGVPILLDIARDTRESLSARICEASAADILLTIGGASVGEKDLVRRVLEDKGAHFDVLKAAMRPGKPVMFGILGTQRVLSLPGNPASAVICARVFLKPLLDRLLGRDDRAAVSESPLARPLSANGEREHYMRARMTPGGVEPISDQDSSLVGAFAGASCLIVRPVRAPALAAGALVPIIPLDF